LRQIALLAMILPMVDAAVYFPYINTPEDAWFFRVLLYWDEVKSIIPEGDEAHLHLDDFTTELLRAELITSVNPTGHVNQPFCEAFLSFLDAGWEDGRAAQPEFSPDKALDVHVTKLGHDLVEELAERRLADPEAPYGWVQVERHTAQLFMAFLAVSLARASGDGHTAITDDPEYLTVFAPVLPELQRERVKRPFLRSDTPRQEAVIRSAILERAMPGPVDRVSVADLRQFKDHADNRERLRGFRRFIEARLRDVCAETDPYVQDQLLRQLQRDIDDEVRAISERLGKKWRNAAAAVWSVIPNGAGTVAAVARHDPADAVAQGSLFVQALGRAAGVARGGELLKSPLAFAALAQRAFPAQG
jgi:hypothetical protein